MCQPIKKGSKDKIIKKSVNNLLKKSSTFSLLFQTVIMESCNQVNHIVKPCSYAMYMNRLKNNFRIFFDKSSTLRLKGICSIV